MQKQQMYGNSCGAASLLCAAGELGVTQLPELTEALSMGQPLAASNQCESALYQITSGATTGSKPVNRNLSEAGYSLPHNMVLAARLLGLDAEVYMNGRTASALTLVYPKCKTLCEESNVPIRSTAPPTLRSDQRLLKVVGVIKGAAGLHYVMQRSNGSYMDPADGRDYETFDAMNNTWTKSYAETGVSILVARSEQRSRQLARRNSWAGATGTPARSGAGTSRESPF